MKLTRTDWFFITFLILFAAGLRIVGNTFGQPAPEYARSTYSKQMIQLELPLQPDEYEFVAIPLEMVVRKTLTPGYVNRGLLTTLDFIAFGLTGAGDGVSLAEREGQSSRQFAPFHLYVIGRTFSALGGVLAVASAYATARHLAGRFGAWIAACITAVSLPLVQHGHYATPSGLAAGLVALTIWACFMCLSRRPMPLRMWLLAGIGTGLASASRYNAAAVITVLFLSGIILIYRNRSTLRPVLAGYVLAPVSFLLATPQFILTPRAFLEHFKFAVDQYVGGKAVLFPISREQGLLLEYRYIIIFGLGVPAALMVLLGLYTAWKRRPTRGNNFLCVQSVALNVSLLLIYLIAYSLVVLRTVRPSGADQLLLPVLPTFAVLAGLGTAWLRNQLPWLGKIAMPALTLAVTISPLIMSVQFVHQLTQLDTRLLMQNWIYQHLPRGSHIHLNGPYNVPLDTVDYQVSQSYAADLISIAELQAKQVDYMILSDAWYYDSLRSPEVTPPTEMDNLRQYLDHLEVLPRLAWINRPVWTGYDWFGHTPSYWHNPGLTVYCVHAKSCAAVR